MSMRNYGISYYGIVAKMSEINLDELKKAYEIEENEALEEYLFQPFNGKDEAYIIPKLAIGDLEGDFIPLLLGQEYVDIDAERDEWVLFDLPFYPSLFNAAYKNIEELIDIMKKLYGKYVADENFEWENRLVHLLGSIYG